MDVQCNEGMIMRAKHNYLINLFTGMRIPVLVILAIQILGVERAWNVMDTVKAIRMAVPVP